MKTRSIRLHLLTLAATTLSLATLGASHARAQANLAFSGGMGGPLTLTLSAPVTYAVTTAPTGSAPLFDFQSVGNVFGPYYSVSGTLSFTINGGTAQTFTYLASGIPAGSLAPTDAYLSNAFPGVAVGDVVVLNAGTLTTGTNFAGAPPASMAYQTFLIDSNGTKLDAVNGVAAPAPEPSTWAAVLGGAGLLGLTLRQRRARLG